MSKVVIINGTSSAGKTSLSLAVQQYAARRREAWQHVSLDQFRDGLPMAWRGLNAPANTTGAEGLNVVPWQGSDEQQGAIQGTSIELGSHGRAVMAGMRRSVAAFADLGLNVIVDDMWCNAEPAQDFAHLLDVENTWVVGLYCGESELARREAQRPTRFPGTAIRENKRVHNVTVNCSYDLELHSDKLSPAVLAEQVFERLSSPPQMLAGLLARGESL